MYNKFNDDINTIVTFPDLQKDFDNVNCKIFLKKTLLLWYMG